MATDQRINCGVFAGLENEKNDRRLYYDRRSHSVVFRRSLVVKHSNPLI
ncbi:hypothetical protein H6F51_16020 [Cyanobacteria bacterium FACHB-DQ100]|nr:hypothetical protein [Cyanobacteria bacterium FACHB-DQ100]